MAILSILLPLFLSLAPLKGDLSSDQVITSGVLGYDLKYRVYTPPGYDDLSKLPVIFLTDGQGYISNGEMPQIIDRLIANREIRPIIAVFVDNRDATTGENRRNEQFLGNDDYVAFYQKELIPHIDETFKTSKKASGRAIMGLSFGGLNAAYFGAKASSTFGMLGIQSPALHPVPEIYDLYTQQERLPLKIFLSTGTDNDTEIPARKLKLRLESKNYDFEYVEVPEGHNWRNWKPLIDDALLYFFGTDS